MNLFSLTRAVKVARVIAKATAARAVTGESLERSSHLAKIIATSEFSDIATTRLTSLMEHLPQVERHTKSVLEVALKAEKAAATAVTEANAAAESALALAAASPGDEVLSHIAARAAKYAQGEREVAEAAAEVVRTAQSAQEAVTALAQYKNGNLLKFYEEIEEIQKLADTVIEATEDAAEAAKHFYKISNGLAHGMDHLAKVDEKKLVQLINTTSGITSTESPTITEAVLEHLKENVTDNDDLSAGTYEQVSLDGTGIAGLIELGIIVAPTVNQYLVKPVVDSTMRYVVQPTLSNIDNYVVQPVVNTTHNVASTIKEAADSLTSFPVAQKIKLNDEEVLSPKFVSYSHIPDQNLKSPQKTDAIWAAAAGKPLTKAETFTPVDNYSSKNLKEIVSPF